MRVTACVVNWGTAGHLPGILGALAAQTHQDLGVVVVDNASGDGSAELVRRRFPEVRLLANRANRGFAGAANQGLARAVADDAGALLLCNPDARPEPDYVARAAAALSVDPRRAAVQGRLWRFTPGTGPGGAGGAHRVRILDTTGHLAFRTRLFRNRGEGQADRGQFATGGPVFGVSGALALHRVAALEDVAIGGRAFDEDLFAFWEDVDVDWRLALRGWTTWYEPTATAWHERGGAGVRRSAVVEELNYANRLLVVLANDDPAALARALPGVAVTTLLKTGELVVTVPSAFGRALGRAGLVPRALAKRRAVMARATVDPAAVVERWFQPFDYGAWIHTWYGRVRSR